MSLQNLYVENYLSHPAFENLRKPMHLDKDILELFNTLHGKSRERVSEENLEKSKLVLKDIFESLRSQSENLYETLFLNELESHVLRFIENEYEYRQRVKKSSVNSKYGQELARNAFFVSELSDLTKKKIIKLAEQEIEIFRRRASEGLLKRSDLSTNEGFVVSKISSLIDREFKSKGIFRIVSDYVGIEYSYTGLSLELSVAGSSWWKNKIDGVEPPRTMYAHLDESIYAPKSIIYLSPVTEFKGPTTSYPQVYDELETNTLQDIIGRVIGEVGNSNDSPLNAYYSKAYHQSMGSKNFRSHFMMLPNEIKFNSHFGWDLIAGSDFEASIASREVPMLGDSGKFIVFDGSRLLHRGGLIEQGERIVLQVVFWPKGSLRKEVRRKFSRIVKFWKN